MLLEGWGCCWRGGDVGGVGMSETPTHPLSFSIFCRSLSVILAHMHSPARGTIAQV